MKGEDDKNSTGYIKTERATDEAKKLGYRKTKFTSEGRPVYYYNGKDYISPDRMRIKEDFGKKQQIGSILKHGEKEKGRLILI